MKEDGTEEANEGQGGLQRKEMVQQARNGACRCGSACAPVCPCVSPCPPRLPCWAGPSCRQAAPAPPCPALPVLCLFVFEPWWRRQRRWRRRRRREIVLIMPWFQQETAVRHARRLPPSPPRQEMQGRMPRPCGDPGLAARWERDTHLMSG